MAKIYSVQNQTGAVTAPNPGVTTSASLYTMIQLVPATNSPLFIVEYRVSFSAFALQAPFAVDLVETGTVAATVTTYAVADINTYDDPNAPANTSGSSGIPLNLGTSLSGFTSSSEGSISATRVFDSFLAEPVGDSGPHQFPTDSRPEVKPGNVLRLRVKGDGTAKVVASIVFSV